MHTNFRHYSTRPITVFLTLVLLCAIVVNTVPSATALSTMAPLSITLTSTTQLDAGSTHTCVLLTSGAVKCWGLNDFGQLGDGTTTDRPTPVAVSGLSAGVAALTAGVLYTCALLTSGAVECWGSNYYGQLGDGTTTARPTPVAVSGLSAGVTALDTGLHTCVLLAGGAVKCWGHNAWGQLGDGTTTARPTPVAVSGLSAGVTALALNSGHTCVLLTSGAVKCWGHNTNGQLGDGTTTDRPTPVAVSGLSADVTALALGSGHTCVLLTSGAVKCWGSNWAGQLGDGTTTDQTTPVAVSGLSADVTALAGGGSHTCALLTSGAVKCWGYNDFGQLGDGTTTARLTPVDVVGLDGNPPPSTIDLGFRPNPDGYQFKGLRKIVLIFSLVNLWQHRKIMLTPAQNRCIFIL